jgi:hypothetical protein
VSSVVDQAVIDLVEGVPIWGVPGLEVDSCVHELRTFDHHMPVCGRVDQSEAIFSCTFMQAVLAYCWYDVQFPDQLHVMTQAGCVCPLQLFMKLILGLLFRIICWCMYVDERVVEKSAFYSDYIETLVEMCKNFNHVVKLRVH